MTIAFRAAGTVLETTSTNATLAKPAGLAVGDVMTAHWNADTNPTVTTVPTGWTAGAGPTLDGATSTNTAASYWKVADSTDTAATDWTWVLSLSVPISGVVLAFTGVDNTTPMDATGTSLANASSTTINATGLTTVTDNAWLIWVGALNSGTFQPTVPAGYTQRAVGTTYRITVGTLPKTPAGATGTQAGSVGTAREAVGQLLALRPAGAVTAHSLAAMPSRARAALMRR